MDDNIGNRLIILRETLSNMSQGEFCKKLGIKQAVISNIEIGKNGPSNSTIKLVCLTFGVNEAWLRNGEGEIFDKKNYTYGLNLTSIEREIFELYNKLLPENQKAIQDYIMEKYELQELKKQVEFQPSDVRIGFQVTERELSTYPRPEQGKEKEGLEMIEPQDGTAG